MELPEYNTPVIVTTAGGHVFKAQYLCDASMTSNEEPCDQWQAEEGEKYPPCWTDGCCWESNHEESPSDPVISWALINHTGEVNGR